MGSRACFTSPKSNSHILYGGSSAWANRFRYKNPKSTSAFVELAETWKATPEQLYEWLGACDNLVERLEWQTSKTSQGNVGKHESEHNIKVFPKRQGTGSATQQFLEFEVTRNAHMSENNPCPCTVSVMFKDPPAHLIPHAWRILRHVCRGKELFPDKVNEWMEDVLKNHMGQEHEDVQEEEEEPVPSSASTEPSRKRMANDAAAEEKEEEKPPACLDDSIESPTVLDEVKEEQYAEVDWGGGNNEDFGPTELLKQKLEEPITNEEATVIEEQAEVAEIQDGMKFASSLQALPEVVRSDTDDKTAIGQMQAFKEREPEAVRFRAVTSYVCDVNIMADFEDMRMRANRNTRPVDLDVLFSALPAH